MILAIIAGGKGTRLGRTDLPKPMVPILGKPILEYQIELAGRYGIKDIYILSGFMSHVIRNYFRDGKKWGVHIHHIVEKQPLGTAGAIKQLEPFVKSRFMVFYGDTIMDINLKKFIDFDKKYKSIGTLFVHPNDHPYDSDLMEVDEKTNQISEFYSKPHDNSFKQNLVNAALYILSENVFQYIPGDIKSDFGKDIFPSLIKKNSLLIAYRSAEYIKDMGTPDRLTQIENDLLTGRVSKYNNENRRRAIFLDRDGVINKEVNNLRNISDFELIKGVPEAIKNINRSDFLCIVITNQPVIAKGMCSINDLKEIHNKMESLLGLENAYVDKIYFCPHHPERGFKGEIKELKIVCSCRKPDIGMIKEAANDFNIDLKGSYFIGDSTTDILTGINAGMKTYLVNTGYGGKDKKYDVKPSFKSEDLLSAVNQILSLETNEAISKSILEILKLLKGDKDKKVIVAVGGLSRSGKSTVVKFLTDQLKSNLIKVVTISLDDWILPIEGRRDDMTVRDRYQYEKISSDLSVLLKGGEIRLSPYNMDSRGISKTDKFLSLKDGQLIFFDGVIALDHPMVSEIADLMIFVEVDERVRKMRFDSFYEKKGLAKDQRESLYSQRLMNEAGIIKDSKIKANIKIEF